MGCLCEGSAHPPIDGPKLECLVRTNVANELRLEPDGVPVPSSLTKSDRLPFSCRMFGEQPLGSPEAGEGLRLGLAVLVAAEAAQHRVQGALAVLAQALQVEESLLEVLATPLDSREDLEEKHGVSVILMAQVQELQARQDSQQSKKTSTSSSSFLV